MSNKETMTLKMSNPWSDIQKNSERLVSNTHGYQVYWTVEADGNYSLSVKVQDPSIQELNINLKDMKIEMYAPVKDHYQWVLVLERKDSWEIFKKLCDDLISVTADCKNEADLIKRMQNRLKRWQNLLAKQNLPVLSLEVQMGLFAELDYLSQHLGAQLTLEEAIDAWVGSDKDKQDFVTKKSAVEIKSYSTTKGKYVKISSAAQLVTEKENLYLATYALSQNKDGDNIYDLYEQIKENISGDYEFIFEEKVLAVGYSPLLYKTEQLSNFIIDNKEYYHVTNEFPKIAPIEVNDAIVSVVYQVDLNQCEELKIQEVAMEIE